jgi:AraC family transcriptional regulator
MELVIDYIEERIDEDILMADIAKIAYCGPYQFGRVFAYVTGVPLSEYIRGRRLSLAALELQAGTKVIDTALRYGYQSPDAFARAFHAMHGITPREACAPGAPLRMIPRLTFHITMQGVESMEYKIIPMDAVRCVGVTRNFGQWKATEADSWHEKMGGIWKFWDYFLDEGANLILRDKYKLYREPFYQVGLTEVSDKGETIVKIGAQARADETYPDLEEFTIPAATWAVFEAKGTLNQPEHPAGVLMTKILSDWLPSSGYERALPIDLEVYGPGDTNHDNYVTCIWIPVRKA